MKTTLIKLDLIDETLTSTVSLFQYGNTKCFVIEDGFKAKKEMRTTRINGGEYLLIKRTYGKFYRTYKRRFNHKFVCELVGVNNFTDILIHIGNFVGDTSGCLLLNAGAKKMNKSYVGIDSTKAYLDFYKWVEKAFRKGDVWISINRH